MTWLSGINWLEAVHWTAGLIILAEALNKLERTAPLAKGLTWRARLVDVLKAQAWSLLAIGSAGAFAVPFLHLPPPSLREVCVLAGVAVLTIRTRIKEG